ncbi:hypothetical protein P171DRAFT_69068 [Karstenula rhodostoma CBS 690.94]|uniref:Uncharacterized protein n=1 Tax=Karstenula rhodostoma CBS 690.94 TaxID=1392251 RepID=A0A9P4PEH1_9PLEO|nr:hypothetical protein P171DRAFT_69068 [Karstenula rhodostoma CBS 690.94]
MLFSSPSSNQRPSTLSAIRRPDGSELPPTNGQAGDPVTVAQDGISGLAHRSWPPSPLMRRHHIPSERLVQGALALASIGTCTQHGSLELAGVLVWGLWIVALTRPPGMLQPEVALTLASPPGSWSHVLCRSASRI